MKEGARRGRPLQEQVLKWRRVLPASRGRHTVHTVTPWGLTCLTVPIRYKVFRILTRPHDIVGLLKGQHLGLKGWVRIRSGLDLGTLL